MPVFPVSGPAFIRVEVQMGRVEVVAEPRDDVRVDVSPVNPQKVGRPQRRRGGPRHRHAAPM